MQKLIRFIFILFLISLSGCATAPFKENLPTYNIGGVTYYPLAKLCDARGIDWQYDTFTRIANLNKGTHRISLRAGDNLVLVDNRAMILSQSVDIYDGTIVVPISFKERVLDVLFKEPKISTARKGAYPISAQIKKIVVDAGHGGNDPGAIGRTGLREKDVNLDIAKRLAVLLKSEGVDVVLTRNSDRFIPLDTRVQITNNSKADLFISIHSNANRSRSMNGFEIYYVATSVNDSKRALIAARSLNLNLNNVEFASRSLDLRAMLWDMLYAYDRAESIYLGRSICRSITENLDVRVIGVKDARYQVLRGARMPAILIEIGFLSNSQEERMLRDVSYRAKIAQSIIYGISSYAQGLASTEVAKR